jgi:CheY-like chemotaxis protein
MSATLTHSGNDDISCSIVAKRILIADDSVTIQKAFAMTFAGEDVVVNAARSVDEAFALAQKQKPDLIIADGAMPGRTGYDLCVQVRGDASLRGVPVYILSSGQQPYDEVRGQKAGADGQLTKPWDTVAFIQQVTALANGAAALPRRTTGSSIPVATVEEDADYGEISIEPSGPEMAPAPPPPAPAPAPIPMPRSPTPPLPAAPLGAPPGMRPSLIPGLRPGAVSPARPGTAPMRPLVPPAAPPRPAAAPAVGRTMIGLPAAGAPIPGVARPAPTMPPIGPGAAPVLRAPFAPAPPPAAPPPAPAPVVPFAPPAPPPARGRTVTPTPTPAPVPVPRARLATPAPVPPPPAPPPAVVMPPAAMAPAVAQSIDQKLAAISAKGPEYEAIAKLSREIIEQVVWEVVPDLAEAIIREHLEKRGRI